MQNWIGVERQFYFTTKQKSGSLGRLKDLLQNLQRNQELLENYDKVMQE